VHRQSILIVTPALADANNGNWQTARRWSRMLASAYRVQLCADWPAGGAARPAGAQQPADPALMIALHARRSAPAVAAWRSAWPQRPLLLALTGTDLYHDIDRDVAAQRSLAAADALVVLNELGATRLPPPLRPRCHVVLQSCSQWRTLPKTGAHLRALMVGHLRPEKDPRTYFRAVARLASRPDLRFDHVGGALDQALGHEAAALQRRQPQYRWLGALGHAATRRRIQAAHVLVHSSRIEGGAHVVIEAVRSGTPVLASRIDGNVGLLGADYAGYFPPGDDGALAVLLERVRDDPAMLPGLRRQIDERASLFAPAGESAALHRLLGQLLARPPGDPR
jgi:putative glycosyltransferase (TIGR04348 family)